MWLRTILCLLLLSVTVRAQLEEEEFDEYQDVEDEVEERAFLVVQKKILESEVPDGTNVTVILTLYNAGTRAAGNVVVAQPVTSGSAALLSTEIPREPVERLNPGLKLTYRTHLMPKVTGQLVLEPTKVTYAPAYNSLEEQVAYSSVPAVMVLTTNEYLISKILLMGSYMTLGMVNTPSEWNRFGLIAAVAVLFLTLNYIWQKLTEARTERLRRRATEYIEKTK